MAIILIEVCPEDLTRSLKEVIPGVFATGRQREVTEDWVTENFRTGVASHILKSKVGFLDEVIYDQLLPEDQRKETKDA